MRRPHPSQRTHPLSHILALGGSLLFLLTFSSHALETIRIPASPTLSPDAKTIAFDWAGDIWLSGIDGGEARRLTSHPGLDTNPRISRDGKTVFFNSTRTGSLQVFSLPIIGGVPKQITYHTEGNFLEDLHPEKPVILVSGIRDHAGRRPTRLIEKPLDPTLDEVLLFDATGTGGRYSPDGKKVLFTRSGAPPYRKGYTGPQASRIWLYDIAGQNFSEPVAHDSGCRFPIWAADGKSFFYVTARSGAFNIWRHELGKEGSVQLTTYPNDAVFSPALSHDGSTLIYRHLFDLNTLATDGKSKPSKLTLHHRTTLEHPKFEARSLRATSDATVTATGLEWAFTSEGEIWTMDTVLKEPLRITDSPAHESDIYFSEKGDYLYYLKDNGIDANYWRMSKTSPKDFWWHTEDFKHEPVTKGAQVKSGFQFSPDNKLISYLEYPGTLWIAKPDGSEPRKLIETWTSFDYQWSPDGRHIAYAVADPNYNTDIFIISTDGKTDPINVSRHPDSDYAPRWSPDGKILAFAGRRHSTSTDIFFVHLMREGHFLSDRDRRLDSARKTMKKDPAYKPKEQKKKKKKKPDPLILDLHDVHKRILRIPLNGMSPAGLGWTPNSSRILFQSNGAIHQVEPKPSARPSVFYNGSASIIRYKNQERLYVISGGAPAQIYKGRMTKYGFKVPFKRDREAHQRMGYRQAWRTLRDVFYDPKLNNRDWDQVREKYELAAAKAPTRANFRRVMSLLLGELNASHMGFYPSAFPKEWSFNEAWRETTPHLGITLDDTLTITAILPEGPADRPQSLLYPGERLLKIDGRELRGDTPLTVLLNGRMDRDIILTVMTVGNELAEPHEREVTIRPISYGQARSLAQAARLNRRREKVEESTDGKLGYLHVARMAWSEFEKFEHHIYERGAGKDGLIIDVRDNGGGFTADHLLTVLTQPLHAYTIGRNGDIGYPQDRHVYASWNKPIVVLCNENSFSNAEIFAHAVKTLDRGKVVGMPTAGGVISTWSTTVMDLGRMRLPGRGWFLPDNGEDMELYGAVPHVLIDVAPDDLPSGRDPQLTKAIEVLKEEVAKRGKEVAPPIYRSQRQK